ncbi:hypothetical protein AB685_14925 [Bacillus sp. LL01]|uniref:hypothetical protein n=1 Tax=Bacillus sp. LL01 TaxID=1665556 RepID=UPI00064D3585|nr:hypothetical protein [Bacillus sp. LL01]KMJ58096.1 hypothetical protein AB685_14925 [Bacillus sp. LL01]
MTHRTKVVPNDKQALLDGKNYEMYNLDLMRKVFPRIIAEHDTAHNRVQRKPQIRDVIALYFYLLSYVDGKHTREDGTKSDRFGASFPSHEKISADLGIAAKRIKPLVDVLEANGLVRTKLKWNGKWYYVSFCPRITDEGYLVNADGEKVVPDNFMYLAR